MAKLKLPENKQAFEELFTRIEASNLKVHDKKVIIAELKETNEYIFDFSLSDFDFTSIFTDDK